MSYRTGHECPVIHVFLDIRYIEQSKSKQILAVILIV